MRTMKNMFISNTEFINWMLSMSKYRRFTMIDNIGKTLVSKGLSSGKIVRALRHIHTCPSVVLKRLSSKEIVSHTRKKRKSTIKSKRDRLSSNKIETVDTSVKEDNGFYPIITSVRSLRNDEVFDVNEVKNKPNTSLITEEQCKLPIDEIIKHAENANIDKSGISSSENSEQLCDEINVSIGKSSEEDSLKVNEFVNKNSDGSRETSQTKDMPKHMPRKEIVENKDMTVENRSINKSIKHNSTLIQADKPPLQNNIKTDISTKEQISQLQEKIKLNLINKRSRGMDNNLEEKLKLHLYNDVSSAGVRGLKEDSSGSKNSPSIGEVVQLKETSDSLETHDKPINSSGDLNAINKIVTTESIMSLNTEETKSANNVQDQLSTCNEPRTETEKNVENKQSQEPLCRTSLHTDQARAHKSHKPKKLKVTKNTPKESHKNKSLKSGSNTSSDQREVIKALASQAKYLEECLIARKRSAKLDLEIPKPKVKKTSIEALFKKNESSGSSQNVNEKSQTKLKETLGDFRKIVDNLEEVLSSNNKQQTTTETHSITTLDKRQPNNNLPNDESLKDEVKNGPKIVGSLVENSCNSEGKDHSVSEHAISDCTVSSSSMIEAPLETCFSHDVDCVVDSGISEIVPLPIVDKKQRSSMDTSEEFDGVENKQYLLSKKLKMTDKECQLPSQSFMGEEKLINDSVNLYLDYFENSTKTFTSVPIKIQQAIKSLIISKQNSVKDITNHALIKEYLTLYTTLFDVVNNKIVNKTAEFLHLAIADYNRREERTKLAWRLNTDILRDEEINRANCDYKEILKLRGAKFSEMFQSVLNKFENVVFMLMTVTFFFRIIQALLVIDSENIKYFNLIKTLMLKLLTANNQECSCYSFFNLSDLELESNYQFVKNCLIAFYFTKYIQEKPDTRNTYGFRFALFGPTSNKLKNMVSELIVKYKPDLDQVFILPSSCTNELTNKTVDSESIHNLHSSTQCEKSDQNSVISGGMIQLKSSEDSNINLVQNAQIYQENNELPKSFEEQTFQKRQKLQDNQGTAHESHFNLQKQAFIPKQQSVQAIGKNQMPTLQISNQQHVIQPQTSGQTHFVSEPLQRHSLQTAGQPSFIQRSLQKPNLQSFSQILLRQKLVRAAVQNQFIRTSFQQPNTHALSQQKLLTSILPTRQNTNVPPQNQVNNMPQPGLQYPYTQTVTKQENSNLSSQNQLLQPQHSLQNNNQRNLIQTNQTQSFGKRPLLQAPVHLQPVITVSQQPTQAHQAQQRFSFFNHKPSTQVSPSSTGSTQPSLPQIQNLFDHLKHRESLQRNGRSGESETLNPTVITNTRQLQPIRQPPVYHANVRPPQYPWPNQPAQQQVRQPALQPVQQPAHQVQQPAHQLQKPAHQVQQPVHRQVQQPAHQQVQQPAHQQLQQPAHQQVQQPARQQVQQPAHRQVQQPAYQQVQQPAQQQVQQPAHHQVQQPAHHQVQQSARQQAQQPAHHQVQQPARLQVQHSVSLTNSKKDQPTDGNDLTMEEWFGSKMCAVRDCGRQATIACSSCRAVFYCSPLCQRYHWYTSHATDACGLNN